MKGQPSKRKQVLLERLAELAQLRTSDMEEPHREADEALLTYINDMDVRRAFERIRRFYA